MALEQVKAFFDAVAENKELQEKLNAADKAYNGDAADKAAVAEAILLPIAKEAGYDFTAEEFIAYNQEAKASQNNVELADDELEAVAGGEWVFCLPYGIGWAEDTCRVFGLAWGFKQDKDFQYEREQKQKQAAQQK